MDKHQISLVGKEISVVYYGIKKFAPDVIHLIVTDEVLDIAARLKDIVGNSIDVRQYFCEAFKIKEINSIVQSIIDDAGQAHFSVNMTGGNKIMAVATLPVAQKSGADIFYFTTSGEIIDVSSFVSRKHGLKLDNDELIQLSGNSIKSYSDIANIPQTWFDSAYAVFQFILKQRSCYKKIRKHIDKWYIDVRNGYHLPDYFELDDGTFYEEDDDGFAIVDPGGIGLLEVNKGSFSDLVLNGYWWELLVASAAQEWAPDREIWLNVKFPQKGNEDLLKNEVDVLVNLDTIMLFVECKSGKISQNDINRMLFVKDTYGGSMSKSVLFSLYPLESWAIEKCEDSHINVFQPENFKELPNILKAIPEHLNKIVEENRA